MSGIYGICEPGCALPVTMLSPMLEVTRPPEYLGPKVDTSRGALLAVTPRSRMRTTAILDGLCMALDADFHNYKELANLSEGFPAEDIARAVMRLYQKYGLGFVQWFDGPFSLALWDAANQRLILAIDRMGIRSLFWRREKTRILFASQLAAIRAVQHEPPRVDPFAVMQFLIFAAVPAPLSIDGGTQKIAPGHLLVFEKDQVKAIRYWDLHYKEEDARNVTAWAEDLRNALGSAIHPT